MPYTRKISMQPKSFLILAAIIFFTVLGGIRLFGLLGLIMGPLVFALFLSVFEILRTMEEGTDA